MFLREEKAIDALTRMGRCNGNNPATCITPKCRMTIFKTQQ